MLIFAVLVVCNEYLEDLVLIHLSSMTMTLKIQLKITKIIIGQLSIIGCLHRLSIVCHFNTNIDFIVANHVQFLVCFKLHIIFKVISIWFHVCNSFCVSIKHITLICQHDKLPLVIIIRWYALSEYITYWVCTNLILMIISSFCTNFVAVISQEQNQQSCWNLYSIFVNIRNRQAKLFSVITQPWRHPGAILCFQVINDIIISVNHKLTKFNTHKLQIISQRTNNPCLRARHDAHVRARQNLKLLKIQI